MKIKTLKSIIETAFKEHGYVWDEYWNIFPGYLEMRAFQSLLKRITGEEPIDADSSAYKDCHLGCMQAVVDEVLHHVEYSDAESDLDSFEELSVSNHDDNNEFVSIKSEIPSFFNYEDEVPLPVMTHLKKILNERRIRIRGSDQDYDASAHAEGLWITQFYRYIASECQLSPYLTTGGIPFDKTVKQAMLADNDTAKCKYDFIDIIDDNMVLIKNPEQKRNDLCDVDTILTTAWVEGVYATLSNPYQLKQTLFCNRINHNGREKATTDIQDFIRSHEAYIIRLLKSPDSEIVGRLSYSPHLVKLLIRYGTDGIRHQMRFGQEKFFVQPNYVSVYEMLDEEDKARLNRDKVIQAALEAQGSDDNDAPVSSTTQSSFESCISSSSSGYRSSQGSGVTLFDNDDSSLLDPPAPLPTPEAFRSRHSSPAASVEEVRAAQLAQRCASSEEESVNRRTDAVERPDQGCIIC